jgi:hypothetical protein
VQEDLGQAKLQSASLIVLGRKHRFLKPLLDETEPPDCPMVFRVRPQPLSPNLLAASFISSAEVTPAALDKIFAFPFYSTYCMKAENQFSRTLAENQRGIQLQLQYP